MSRYAESTTVAAEASRAEIERTIRRYGADSFMYGYSGTQAAVQFAVDGRHVKFVLEMPDPDDDEFVLTPTGRERSEAQADKAWEQATRQRWRALALVIKAKLEAVEAGITVFDAEFLAHIILPDGSMVGDRVQPLVEEAYLTGQQPNFPLALGPGD